MAGRDIIEMRVSELRRLKVIESAIEGRTTQKAAAESIGISERQIRRLIRAVREQGQRGVVHKLRGRASNRKTSQTIRDKVVKLYGKKYLGFGPTLFVEKLLECERMEVSRESVRKWLIEAGLWKKARKRSTHRQWRARKESFGAMVQMDGSHHNWLEGRGADMVLMGYIDDATGIVFGRFYESEGTLSALDSFKRYVSNYGLPQSVYLDRHSTYKSKGRMSDEELMAGLQEPLSQFQRALGELGVEVIHAYSPQAKGRVERLFGVLQDRLVKEMRLRGIRTKDEANEFLKEYVPQYNRKFGRQAANSTDMHVAVPAGVDLDGILCIKAVRTPKADNTITYKGKLYAIEGRIKTKRVSVEERLDGSMQITSKGERLRYREVEERPKVVKLKMKAAKPKTVALPSAKHPWRMWQDRSNMPKKGIIPY